MKKLMLMLLALSLTTILIPKGAGATTYYVDAVYGRDKNSGTSASSPWKTLTKVSNSSFLPSDKVLFRRNQTWVGRLVIRSSGLNNMPITLGDYGSGNKPVLNGNNVNYAVLLDGIGFITIQNLAITNRQGQGLLIYESRDNGLININYCDIYNNLYNGITIKDRGNTVIKKSRIYANGRNGISVYYSNDTGSWTDILGHNIWILDNDIHSNGRHGVYLAGHNAVMQRNTIYLNGRENSSHNVYLIGDNSLIESNIFRDGYMMGFRYEGSNMTFRYNFLKSNYKHNLSFWNDFPDIMSNNRAYYNIFVVKKISDPSNITSMAIFVGKDTYAGIFDGIKFYNNSIYASDDNAGGIWLEGCDNIEIENNIIKIGNCCLIYKESTALNLKSDYNIFASTEVLPIYTGRIDVDFHDWQALGYDYHSRFTDPVFVNPAPETYTDFALQPTSPAIGAGINLSFTRDFLGNPVPFIPDIGALQHR